MADHLRATGRLVWRLRNPIEAGRISEAMPDAVPGEAGHRSDAKPDMIPK
jgi:hypothetical protein